MRVPMACETNFGMSAFTMYSLYTYLPILLNICVPMALGVPIARETDFGMCFSRNCNASMGLCMWGGGGG